MLDADALNQPGAGRDADPAAAERVWTVVVAGGTGHRFGRPKQYEVVGGRRVVDHAVATAGSVGQVVVVLPPADATEAGAVAGGATRSESVRHGLAAVPPAATVICVHDAARPLASVDLYRAVIGAVADGADGAVPGLPVTDTIKLVTGPATERGRAVPAVIDRTLPRDRLVAVQTPQAFRADVLRAAHAAGSEATDDAALVEQLGGRVVVVPGEVDNRKITHPDDLSWLGDRLGVAP